MDNKDKKPRIDENKAIIKISFYQINEHNKYQEKQDPHKLPYNLHPQKEHSPV